MDRIFNALRPFIRAVTRHAGWVLAAALLLAAGSFYYAQQLRIDTDLANLIPDDYDSVQALEKLRDTVGSEKDAAVAITSPSFQANKAFAEDLIPKALDLTGKSRSEPYLTRVQYRRDTEFLKDNALYFASNSELDRVQQFLEDKIEEAKQEANPFFFELEDEEEDASADSTARELEQMYDQLVGTSYPISDDSTTMVLKFYPSGAQTDIGFIENLYADLRGLIDRMEPQSYHPQMEVIASGALERQLIEVNTIQNDVLQSSGSGIFTVLLLVVLYFAYKAYRARAGRRWSGRIALAELLRAPVMALIIGLPLVMSLLWTGGLAYLAFGDLNLMTSTLGLVLFGLGIDFGIHYYGRYAEERAEGQPVAEAIEIAFQSTGQAIAVGAMTTASALYVLTIADFKGFSQFGFIAGTGILLALFSMTVVLPALLAVFERMGVLDLEARAATTPAKERRDRSYPAARPIVIGSFVAVAAAFLLLPRVQFEYHFGALEPTYDEYNARKEVVERVSEVGGAKRNPAYIVVDSPQEAEKVANAVREKARRDTTSPTILDVETLQERFPLRDAAKQQKLARIEEIRGLLNGKYLRNETSDAIQKLRRAAQTQSAIPFEQVPEFLQKQFTTKSGEFGTFVMVYPSVGLSNGRKSMAFAEDVGTITTEDGETYHAGSTSLVAADMLRLMLKEAPWMVGATFLIVALLMGLNFRSVRWAGLALIPLVVGVLWMLLLMEVFGLKLNFYNLVVLPAVLGIGNDAGVHLVHRYREEGRGSIWHVLRSTGEHVTMGSLTTMIGFAGLLLSFHPGLRSIGELAVAGIGATLLAALFFLPALLQWMEDREASPAESADPSVNGAPQSREAAAREVGISDA